MYGNTGRICYQKMGKERQHIEMPEDREKLKPLDVICAVVCVIAIIMCVWGGAFMYQKGYEAAEHYYTEVAPQQHTI